MYKSSVAGGGGIPTAAAVQTTTVVTVQDEIEAAERLGTLTLSQLQTRRSPANSTMLQSTRQYTKRDSAQQITEKIDQSQIVGTATGIAAISKEAAQKIPTIGDIMTTSVRRYPQYM